MKDRLLTNYGKKVLCVFMALMMAVMLVPVAALTSVTKAFAMEHEDITTTPTTTMSFTQSEDGTIYDSAGHRSLGSRKFSFEEINLHVDESGAMHIFPVTSTQDATEEEGKEAKKEDSFKEAKTGEAATAESTQAEKAATAESEKADEAATAESTKAEEAAPAQEELKDEDENFTDWLVEAISEPETAQAFKKVKIPSLKYTMVLVAYANSGKVFDHWVITNNTDGNAIDLTSCTGTETNINIKASTYTEGITISAVYKSGVEFSGAIAWSEGFSYIKPSVFFANEKGYTYEAKITIPEEEGNDVSYSITIPEDVAGTFYCVARTFTTVTVDHKVGDKAPNFELEQVSQDDAGVIRGSVYYYDNAEQRPEELWGNYYVFAYQNDKLMYAAYVNESSNFSLLVKKGQTYDKVIIYCPGFVQATVSNVVVPSEAEEEDYPSVKIADVTLQLDENYALLNFDENSFKSNEVEAQVLLDGDEVDATSSSIAIPKGSHYSVDWQTGQFVLTAAQVSPSTKSVDSEVVAAANALMSSGANSSSDVLSGFDHLVINLKAKEGYTFFQWNCSPWLGTDFALGDEGYFLVESTLGVQMQECGYLTINDASGVVNNYTYVLATQELEEARKATFDKIEAFEMMTPSTFTVKNGKLVSKFTLTANDDDPYYYNFSIAANLKNGKQVEQWVVNGSVLNEGDTIDVKQNDKLTAQPVVSGEDTIESAIAATSSSAKTGDNAWVWFVVIGSLAVAGFGTYEIARRRAKNN